MVREGGGGRVRPSCERESESAREPRFGTELAPTLTSLRLVVHCSRFEAHGSGVAHPTGSRGLLCQTSREQYPPSASRTWLLLLL